MTHRNGTASGGGEVLAELARVKVLFQLRAIETAMGIPRHKPTPAPTGDTGG